jgi:hypothetical protein
MLPISFDFDKNGFPNIYNTSQTAKQQQLRCCLFIVLQRIYQDHPSRAERRNCNRTSSGLILS